MGNVYPTTDPRSAEGSGSKDRGVDRQLGDKLLGCWHGANGDNRPPGITRRPVLSQQRQLESEQQHESERQLESRWAEACMHTVAPPAALAHSKRRAPCRVLACKVGYTPVVSVRFPVTARLQPLQHPPWRRPPSAGGRGQRGKSGLDTRTSEAPMRRGAHRRILASARRSSAPDLAKALRLDGRSAERDEAARLKPRPRARVACEVQFTLLSLSLPSRVCVNPL